MVLQRRLGISKSVSDSFSKKKKKKKIVSDWNNSLLQNLHQCEVLNLYSNLGCSFVVRWH